MVFVNEVYSIERTKELGYGRRTIDYENESWLVYRQSFDMGQIAIFDFTFRGSNFEVASSVNYESFRKMTKYTVYSVDYKSGNHLPIGSGRELLNLLGEALIRYGFTGSPTRQDKAEVTFNSKIIKYYQSK